MGSHQRHTRHGGNGNWQDESRDEQGRFRSGNWGSSDGDGQYDRNAGRSRMMGSQHDDDSNRDHGRDRSGRRYDRDTELDMNQNDRDRGNYEADYGFPQGDRDSRWNESGRADDYRRAIESRDRDDRGQYGSRDDMWRDHDGDDRSGQGGYPMGSNTERSMGRGDRTWSDGRDRRWDYGRNVGSSYDMGSPSGYDADNYRGSEPGGRWSSQGDASQGFESRHRGEHAGKGPKGYQRSDERIEEDVNEALSHDASLDASEIEVSVKDGEVTLTGTVPDRQMKRRAEDCAEQCSGVRQVQNHLRLEVSDRQHGSTTDSSRSGKSGSKHSGNGAPAGSGANSTSGGTSKPQSSSSSH